MATIKLSDIVWEPSIYPRSKWNTETIKRYADAIKSGAEFPPLTLEKGTNRLLDGKHTLEAFKSLNIDDVPVRYVSVPNGMSARYFAATLSSAHGDRLSNADLKALAEQEFEIDSSLDPKEWGQRLGLSKSTVYRWVSHVLNRAKAGRETQAWHLSQLGWTQAEIAERLGVDRTTISLDVKNSHLGKIRKDLGPDWNEQGVAEWANRLDVPLTDAWAAVLDGLDDAERMERLGIKVQPYDVWNFNSCHDLMGDNHPGRIPGELVCHILWYYTKPGDLVVDPMAGSGTTLDACLLMGRKARGYDIDLHHDRVDIEEHNLDKGWPDTVKKASLIFWDPPYFSKKDDEYVDGSISRMESDSYMKWIEKRLKELSGLVRKGTHLLFLMSDWDPEGVKGNSEKQGIFIWDYANILRKGGWTLTRQIQCPLPTQQVHPDIVNKFRESRRMARLGRYLLEAYVE